MARCESHYCWKCTGSCFWVLSIFLLLLTREVSLDNDYQYIAKDILEEANDYSYNDNEGISTSTIRSLQSLSTYKSNYHGHKINNYPNSFSETIKRNSHDVGIDKSSKHRNQKLQGTTTSQNNRDLGICMPFVLKQKRWEVELEPTLPELVGDCLH